MESNQGDGPATAPGSEERRRLDLDIVGSSDPYLIPSQTWPRLDPEIIERIKAYGRIDQLENGTYLFLAGDRQPDFFVILGGAVDILEHDGSSGQRLVVSLVDKMFTGEADMLDHRGGLVSARARGPTEVVRVTKEDFQRMMRTESDIGEIVLRSFILRRLGLIQHHEGSTVVVGNMFAGDTLRLQSFLTRNTHPHKLLDTGNDPDAARALETFHLGADALPAVILQGRRVLKKPSNRQLADALGITDHVDPERIHDVAVVGAGPAGLAAAVYASSEGLDTIVIEANVPGGQAGSSSRIENYLGFPMGISGMDLAARAQVQAHKFGARLEVARAAASLVCQSPFRILLDDGDVVTARAVVVATGARYRRLDVPGFKRFEGQGVHFAATFIEGRLCEGAEIAVVGGGNSAGQAAVYLSGRARRVHMLVRECSLSDTMSDYLVRRIEESPRITLHVNTEVSSLHGDTYLEQVGWRERGGPETLHPVTNLFLMIGAAPNSDWLRGCVDLDPEGFIRTGHCSDAQEEVSPYATSVPGLFAVGDVRSGSVKRVASGVGEGSVVVHSVHRWLASQGADPQQVVPDPGRPVEPQVAAH